MMNLGATKNPKTKILIIIYLMTINIGACSAYMADSGEEVSVKAQVEVPEDMGSGDSIDNDPFDSDTEVEPYMKK